MTTFAFDPPVLAIADGVTLLRGYVRSAELLDDIATVAAASPHRNMVLKGGGRMAVATTSCGTAGWYSDAARGYRYTTLDPLTSQPWPAMPAQFLALARAAALAGGFNDFDPDSCLINRYDPGVSLGLHQDKNERDFTQPIVSVSLGASATFMLGGFKRTDKTMSLDLHDGDVLVWGGPARMRYHGVKPLRFTNPAQPLRVNLTFRKAL